jgi:thiamine pyrophosphate-dependent acetolactate synthase large subunit-like protein
MSKKVAQVIVETLQSAGVKNCYGIVGDTLNQFAASLSRSDIKFVHMRHEEAGAYAAQGEALLMDRLTAVAGSCGPGSLHFINGLYEANRNRAPVILIASQVVRSELGFNFIQEVDFQEVYRGCSVFCEMILTPEQALRKTVMACQAAISKRGVAVLIVPVDIADSDAASEPPFRVHVNKPVIRPSDEDLDRIADMLAPDFGKVAEAMGLWGKTVSKAEDLEGAVAEWLGQPGPALLNVKVEPMELVMPPFTAPEAVYGMAMYSIKAVMHGKAGDVFEMIGENL